MFVTCPNTINASSMYSYLFYRNKFFHVNIYVLGSLIYYFISIYVGRLYFQISTVFWLVNMYPTFDKNICSM